jgi:hypothetical protein
MPGVRNGPLTRAVIPTAGTNLVGFVPANFTWILKTSHFTNYGPTAVEAYLWLRSNDGLVVAQLPTVTVEPGAGVVQEVWTTLGPGDELHIQSTGGPLHVWCNGADLPGSISF